jgi:hypothetical protein
MKIQGTYSNISNSSRSPNIDTFGHVASPMNLGGYSNVFASTKASTSVSSSRNWMSQKDAHIHMAVLFAIIVLRRTNHRELGSPWVAVELPLEQEHANCRSHHSKTLFQHHYFYSWCIILWHWPHQLLFEHPNEMLQIHAPTAGHPSPRNHQQICSHWHCRHQRMGIRQNSKGYVRAPTGWHPCKQTTQEMPFHQWLLSMSAHAWTVASHVAWHHLLPCHQQLWHQNNQYGWHEASRLIPSRTLLCRSQLDRYLFCRVNLMWDYDNCMVDLHMPDYINKALKYQHQALSKP